MRLRVERFKLANGLEVVVAPDPASPAVAVSLTYRVGSQDERPGLAGFAHLFEHLMAQGTRNLKPREISSLIESNGGVRNAYTMKTNTTYHSVVPTAALELVLWAEADRMHALRVDARALALEQQVVLEELRRSYLNQPYRRAQTEGMGAAVFERFENRHPTIGDAADIRNARLADVLAFYGSHYAPNNAVLALAGDVTLARARRLAGRYFGAVAARVLSPRPDVEEPAPAQERRVDFPDPLAKLPRLMVGWRAPARGSRDYWALMVLAEALSGGEESPLHQELVRRGRLALSTGASMPWWTHHTNARGPEIFGVDVLLKASADPQAALRSLDAFLRRLLRRGLGASDLSRAKTQIEFQWLNGLQFQLERARMLSSYAALIGDPAGLAQDLSRLAAVSRPGLRAAARRWLAGPGRGIVVVRPVPPQPEPPEPPTPVAPPESRRASGAPPPPVGPMKRVRPPRLTRWRLANGLPVLFVRDTRLPLVELRLSLAAGKAAEAEGEAGTSEAAAALLFKGAPGRGAAEIARSFASMGFSVSIESRRELALLSASGLARNLPRFLPEFARILAAASYPGTEVRLWREQTLERMRQARQDPDFMAGEALKEELYRGHPYGRPFPSDGELAAVRGVALRGFRARHFRAAGATLVLVGDVSLRRARRMLEASLGRLDAGAAPVQAPPVPPPAPARLRAVERPGSRQVDLCLAQVLDLRPRDPDYAAFTVLNHILGGSSTSRLFMNLRIDKGWTYGAYARIATLTRCSTWVADAQTRPEVAARALAEMRREVSRLREEPVGAAELSAAKRYLAGTFALRLASLEGMADTLWKLEIDGLAPERELAAWVPRLEAVTSEDVRRTAARLFDPGRTAAIAVGEKAALASLLRA